MPRVTLQTIADRLGVSRMTVSNAFSRPDQLSDELRQRILGVARELGYAGPDPTARALARGSTGAVGVLLTDSLSYAFTDDVATRFLGAIVEELAPTGLALTLLTSDERSGNTSRDIAIDGAIVYSCLPRSTARAWLLRRKLPIVDVDQDPEPEIPSVNVDDRGGARAAAAHLVELGHQRIAILTVATPGPEPEAPRPDATDPRQHHPQLERLEGWIEVLSACDIGPTVRVVSEYSADHAAAAVRSLLTDDERPTAVLCYSDLLALGVLRAARDSGLRVPDDLSVVGFDDSPAARQSEPALTTVRQDVADKGRLAAAALIEAIGRSGEGDDPQIRHEVLPTELVMRASTAPPPAT